MQTRAERLAAAAGRRRERALPAEARRSGGVVHTPPELARHVARAVDVALRGLGREGGLADPDVVVIDPACGPGVFLAAALAVAAGRSTRARLLRGIDVDPDALAAAAALLRGAGPIELVRADTLATVDPPPPGATVAVLGNPPWAGRSASRGADALLEDFRCDADGRRLPERKLGVLSDAYVRFFRWAAEVARRAPGGAVVGLVTNGSFLDGPVHRGMRAALLRWFDRIDVLDLGGSALVARARDGERDDNVFGVRPGVAVTVLVRAARPEPRRASVRHARLSGSRAEKLARLAGGELPPMRRIAPAAPRFLFRPAAAGVAREGWIALDEAMPFHREGVQTNRDAVAIDADPDRLLDRLRAFAGGSRRSDLGPALRRLPHFDPERARAVVQAALASGLRPRPIAYRPFDDRFFVPVAPLCHRPRPELCEAVASSSMVLLSVRKDRGDRPWAHAALTRHVPDSSYLSARSSCRTRAFPTHFPDGRPNLSAAAAAAFAERAGRPVEIEEVVRYALAVLASPAYGRALDAELRLDYPRLPLPPSTAAWDAIVTAGEAIERAFRRRGAAGRGEVTIGHIRVTPAPRALVRAIARADRLVAPLIDARRLV